MEMEKITLGMKPKKEAEDVRNDNYKMLKKDIKKNYEIKRSPMPIDCQSQYKNFCIT